MQTKIYFAGLIATLMVFLGILFKIQHWPGAAILLTTGIFVLLFVFLPLALWNNYKNEGIRGGGLLNIIIWITCLVVFMSMLFKIQHWPGAGYLLIAAIPFPYVVFLPVYLIVTGRNKNHNIYNTVAILFLLAVVSALSALLAVGVSKEKLTDSLLFSENYNRTETALGSMTAGKGSPALTLKIDEALSLIDEYEDLRFNAGGITRQQWVYNPELLPDPLNKNTGAAVNMENRYKLYGGIASALSDIIVTAKNISDNKPLADNIAATLNMRKNSGGGYYFADELILSDLHPWVFVYLDGLRVNLMMLKLTVNYP